MIISTKRWTIVRKIVIEVKNSMQLMSSVLRADAVLKNKTNTDTEKKIPVISNIPVQIPVFLQIKFSRNLNVF